LARNSNRKIDEFTIQFKLNNVYVNFLHNLTISIMPRHLWAGISVSNFPLAQYNLKPIGSGPYKFKNSIKTRWKYWINEFVYNENYYLTEGPFIKKLNIFFYRIRIA